MTKERVIDKEKFESLIKKTAGCFWWYGATDKRSGNAMFQNRNAASIAWEFGSGEKIPEGFHIKRTCENNLCVRFSHLEAYRRTYPWRN